MTLQRLKSLNKFLIRRKTRCRIDRLTVFSMCLEFLSEDEVEVRSALGSVDLVETVGPVDTHHADHREVDADTDSGASLEFEGREVFD